MATKYANATGNWSTMTWLDAPAGSVTTAPGVGDSADLNGKTVTVNQDVTLDAIIGATGVLAVSGSRVLNCNLGDAASGYNCTLSGAQTVTVNGNVVAGITTTRLSITAAISSLIVNGNVVGSATAGTIRGISQTQGTVTINGNVTGGGGAGNTMAVLVSNAAAVMTINGNVTGGSSNNAAAYGAQLSTGTLTINGTVTAGPGTGSAVGSAAYGVVAIGGTLNITGSLVSTAAISAVVAAGCTFTYTPTLSHRVTEGGKVLYPAIPTVGATLSIVDQADGTGATATIGNVLISVATTVKVYSFSGATGNLTLAGTFASVGGGVIDLVLTTGTYFAWLTCDGFTDPAPVFFQVTDAVASYAEDLHNQVLAKIQSLALTGISVANIQKGKHPLPESVVQAGKTEGIVVAVVAEKLDPKYNTADDVTYRHLVVCWKACDQQHNTQNLTAHQKWREQIGTAFKIKPGYAPIAHSRLVSISIEPASQLIFDPEPFTRLNVDAAALVVGVTIRQPR